MRPFLRGFLVSGMALVLLLHSNPAGSMLKQNYGGNLKVADELLEGRQSALFHFEESRLLPLTPIPYAREDSKLSLDLSALNPEWLAAVEKSVTSIQDSSHPCHWILDYPFLDHQHPTSMQWDQGRIIIESKETDYLTAILNSPCLLPERVEFLNAFRRTQFGFEANPNCLSGRPFLDSITPAPVDPVNPYLSFKLNDADVIPVPEDRYQQISGDPQLTILPGPKTLLLLKTANLSPGLLAQISAAIRADELAHSVLNDHAEILMDNPLPSQARATKGTVQLSIPPEPPYRLLGERLAVQLEQSGTDVLQSSTPDRSKPLIELQAIRMKTGNYDLERYLLLRDSFKIKSARPWFEEWDEMEASGRVIPLMIHNGAIAVRKGVQGLKPADDGFPDFGNAWIEPQP